MACAVQLNSLITLVDFVIVTPKSLVLVAALDYIPSSHVRAVRFLFEDRSFLARDHDHGFVCPHRHAGVSGGRRLRWWWVVGLMSVRTGGGERVHLIRPTRLVVQCPGSSAGLAVLIVNDQRYPADASYPQASIVGLSSSHLFSCWCVSTSQSTESRVPDNNADSAELRAFHISWCTFRQRAFSRTVHVSELAGGIASPLFWSRARRPARVILFA